MKFLMWLGCLALFFLAAASSLGDEPKSNQYTFQYDQLLGTTAELRFTCSSSEIAEAAERTALAEIERLAKALSNYDEQSEFSRWSKSGLGSQKVSDDLYAALAAAEDWRKKSGGAFSPSAESVCQLWKSAAKRGKAPTAQAKREAVALAMKPAYELGAEKNHINRISPAPLTLNALGEGLIADAVAKVIADAHPQVTGLLVNLGGDIHISGDQAQTVAITNPAKDADNDPSLCRVLLQNQSIVTSGSYRRGVKIEGNWYSHIIDPRTGEPTNHVRSATVIAPQTIDADVLATILCVMPVEQGLQFIEGRSDTACLIVDAKGKLHRSIGWSQYEIAKDREVFVSTPLADDAKNMELAIELEINKPSASRGYRKPYVAVWLEDKDHIPVRTLAVWTQSGKGTRWLPDLKKWYKSDELRKLADGTEVIDTVSSATKAPGKYKLTWNGLDDAGKPVKPGKYTFYIEAAREHGTYQIMRFEHDFDGKAFKEELKGNEEIKGATLDYRQRSAAAK